MKIFVYKSSWSGDDEGTRLETRERERERDEKPRQDTQIETILPRHK